MRGSRNLAIFDLDYTLTRKGTWGRFMWMCLKKYPWKWPVFLTATLLQQLKYKQGKVPRITVKETMIKCAIKGWSKDRLESLAQKFATEEVPNKLRPGGIKALQAHKKKGDYILIASAAADILVTPITALLNVDGFVATNMGWDGDHRLKQNFSSRNCYGVEKLARVKSYMVEAGLVRENIHVTAYSDSHADVPLFEFADEVVVISPSKKLIEIANNRNWSIHEWD